MKKRGQITIFIILGIIILISIGIAVYFTTKETIKPIKKTPIIAEEVQPVYDYVVNCINEISKDGLTLLGQQGGYITIPTAIQRTPDSFVAADPRGVVKTPLWYYEGEDRTPPLNFMERELAAYIKKRLPECTGNFEAFKEQYNITASKEIIPIVTFTNEHVLIETIWQLKIKRFERTTTLDRFTTSHNVRLKQMWEMANRAMKTENKQQWFENLTIDLMAMNNKIPLNGMELKCGISKWKLSNVKSELKTMLAFFLPQIRIKNTLTPPPLMPEKEYEKLKKKSKSITKDLMAGKEPKWPENTPDDLWEVNRLTWDIGMPETSLKTTFLYYPNWEVRLVGKPHDGGTLKSTHVKGAKRLLNFLCINQWHFVYDVIYPVKMTIKDETAFNGEGYMFNMAFPVVIQNNKPSRSVFGYKQFRPPEFGTEYCDKLGEQIYDVRAMGFTEHSPVAEELENANVTFTCLNRECYLGTTKSDETGAIRLTGYLPQGCSNPLLTVKKEGYLPAQAYYKPGTMEIMMTKLKKMNYSLEVYPYQSTTKQWLLDQVYTKLPKDYTASISLHLKKYDYDQVKEYPANLETIGLDFKKENTLEIAYETAQYDLDVIYLKKDLIVGGYHIENLTINFEDIAGKNEMIIKIIEWNPLPIKEEKQSEMANFIYGNGILGNETYNIALKPEFK